MEFVQNKRRNFEAVTGADIIKFIDDELSRQVYPSMVTRIMQRNGFASLRSQVRRTVSLHKRTDHRITAAQRKIYETNF